MRLVETQGKAHGEYACLSYCWGDSKTQIGQTTRANLSRQLKGIPISDLPDTVIDAIRLSYKLGFRFLWVDRLCIVQDDKKDWSEQASKMCDIYSRCALTISVPICKGSSESFLSQRRQGFREQSRFAAITYTGEESGFKSGSWLCEEGLTSAHGPWFLEYNWTIFSVVDNNQENRWIERAWTFQEWMLSLRILHIDSMTLWDCYVGYANELNRRHVTHPFLLRDPKEFGKAIPWDRIVGEYSSRQITYDKDRLPALAGLAARYAQATGHTYLAGLWREDLPRSLLWMCSDHQATGRANRHAPSWSWASLDVKVQYGFFSGPFNPRASILSVFCEYDPPGSITAVKKAWIEVDGCISVVSDQTGDHPPNLEVKAGDRWWETDKICDHRYSGDAISKANVYLLLLGSTRWGTTWGAETVHGALILEERGWEDGRQCFQRLGVAQLRCKEEELRPLHLGPSWEARVVCLV